MKPQTGEAIDTCLMPSVNRRRPAFKRAKQDYAIEINIQIIRAFVAIRKYMIQASPSSLSRELEEIKERIRALEEISEENEDKFGDIYIALSELALKQKLPAEHRNPIGFRRSKK